MLLYRSYKLISVKIEKSDYKLTFHAKNNELDMSRVLIYTKHKKRLI